LVPERGTTVIAIHKLVKELVPEVVHPHVIQLFPDYILLLRSGDFGKRREYTVPAEGGRKLLRMRPDAGHEETHKLVRVCKFFH
jgi:hypothetical protein